MLPPDYFTNNLADIEVLYTDLHTATLKSIARHVADAVRETGQAMPSTVYQIQAAQAAGLKMFNIEQYVAAMSLDILPEIDAALTFSNQFIRELFEDAGAETLRYDNQVYTEAGYEPIDISQSRSMLKTIEGGISKAIGGLGRLTGVFEARAAESMRGVLNDIYRAENIAYMKTATGAFSYTEAMNDAMDELTRQGITVYSYASGRNISVPAAVLRDLRTGVAQTAGDITRQGAIMRGASYAQVSAHIGARNTGEGYNNHESWQGRAFFYSQIATEQNNAGLPDFVETTGLGKPGGLLGIACRHHWTVFYPGISTLIFTPERLKEMAEKSYTYKLPDGAEKTLDAYAASQHLRMLERTLRRWKTIQAVEEAKGDLARPEVITEAKRKVREWSGRIKKFTDETGMRRQRLRERVAQ